MLEIQLYINNQRLDMFKDESISLTDSIQNVRDIDKIFTSFSRTFNLPASKTNSKIFKHYYNFHIDEGFAFDARVKTPANIELNSLPFRKGYIQLTGVELKDNVPYSYKITFFGEMVKLKDAIGERKLSDLDLSQYDRVYSASDIQTKIQESPVTTDVIVPLITHTQRLYYSSSDTDHNTGNLSPSSNKHGVYWNQLKYALRVNKIIEAIEDTYPELQFTSDFFKNASIPEFSNLFLWLSRKSGAVENLSANETEITTTIPWGNSGTCVYFCTVGNNINTYSNVDVTSFKVNFTTSNNTTPYKIELYHYATPVYTEQNVIGSYTFNVKGSGNNYYQGAGAYQIRITTSTPITFSDIQVVLIGFRTSIGGIVQFNRNTGSFTTANNFQFNFDKQMPDMTIIDFLSGLFRTFNLTAYVQEDGKIKVQPLNQYYDEDAETYDITEYVGIDKHSVNSALPYREIKFLFKDTKTFFANKFGEIFNKAWGLIQYNDSKNNLSGSLYKVESPFGHFMYERLVDGTKKNIQWGWSVDKSQNAALPSPLLFYAFNPASGTQIQFVNDINQDGTAHATTTLYSRSMPSNTIDENPAVNPFQLNFNLEQNEWTGDESFTETLYSKYYESYIASVFNPKQRLTIVEVKLPLALLLKIQMKDRIIIAGNHYVINKLNTNLQTGKSELELINKFN